MAKKTTATKSTGKRPSTKATTATAKSYNNDIDVSSESSKMKGSNSSSSSSSSKHLMSKEMLKDLVNNPAVRYVAGGIATAVLTKVATNLSSKYPEISRFISENLDNVEGRLSDFKNSLNNSSESEVSRH